MEYRRAYYMYGDTLWYYPVTIYLFFFGIGWLYAKYGETGFSNVFARVLMLCIALHLTDALIKGAVWIKDNFKLTLTLRE